MIITEEEEEPEEEEIEEVEAFPPVDLGRGESVHSITFIDDPASDGESDGDADAVVFGNESFAMPEPDKEVVNGLHKFEEQLVLEKAKEEVEGGMHQIRTAESLAPSPRSTVAQDIQATGGDQSDPTK